MGEAGKDLFNEPMTTAPITDRRVLYDNDGRKVILIGYTPGKKCKDCANFYYDQRAKVYRRCSLYPKKSWKANWEACSKFEPDAT